MSLNKTLLQARIPFETELKNGDDDKKAYMGFTVSVQRNWKPEGEQYYPEDLIYCKAFGAKAKFINKHFPKGSNIMIEGELRRDDDYEKDGETVKGQMYVNVTDAYFVAGGSKPSEESSTPTKSSKPAASKSKTPGNPLSKKKAPF